MATKTITLELDAYEKLRRMKRGKESFSAVVRRAEFPAETFTGEAIVRHLSSLHAQAGAPSGSVFAYWDKVAADKAKSPRISPSKWPEA